jgi:uncharacterized protein YqgV (UPF0045/DUF77 family)
MDKVRPIVEEVLAYIKSCGLHIYRPYETTIDGDFDTLLKIIRNARKFALRQVLQAL